MSKILDNGHGEAALRTWLPPAIYERLANYGLRLFMVKSTTRIDEGGFPRATIDVRELPRLRAAGLLQANGPSKADAFYDPLSRTVFYTAETPEWAIVHESGHAIICLDEPVPLVAQIAKRWCWVTYGELSVPKHALKAHAPSYYATTSPAEYWAEQVPFILGAPRVVTEKEFEFAKPDPHVRDYLHNLCVPTATAA